ncbi:AzlC family ABC transporter permease [Paenibacillus sp. J22TS3]|uniref:AzlC family ABC transporter permease n=1 Tax=Paenibacillus sp. J22TS3 TaxID=2807192 RepID=UPI001B0B859A|nr:AzlC family ABC transporter permease [Paenibacillus sp. J22TS3]GIP23848.1 branched-chain amino acid ABC transporter permease [Paenibacillus sp. J22TS3]
MNREQFIRGVKDCVPTLLGYLSIGFAAGIIEKTAGLSMMEVGLLSVMVYAGSAQFIFAGMIGAGSSTAGIVATVFFVNLRHLLLSAALSPYFRHLSPIKNALIGTLLTDETFGVASAHASQTKQLNHSWMQGLNLTAYLNWIAANLAGAYLGEWIKDPEKLGLDFALPAMFIGLLVLQIVHRKRYKVDLVVGLTAVIVGVICGIWLSQSAGVIAATLTAATVGTVIERWR